MSVVSALPSASFGYIPAELNLQTLETLPSMSSLKNAVTASGQLHRCFSTYSTSVSSRVLRNEIPKHSWTHAVVANIRHLRDTASQARVTPKDALAISRFHKKVTELRDLFVADCANAKQQQLHPLWDSIRYRPTVQSELIRIERALYLFQILACFCRNMTFGKLGDVEYIDQSREKVASLQKCIVERLMSPWEMYQVIGIQAYFRRAIHGFERDSTVSERIMPSLLVGGIDLMHEALCIAGHAKVADFIAPHEEQALNRPFNAMGVIASRGTYKTWTRDGTKGIGAYAPFCPDNDKPGYASWARLEKHQLRLVGTHQTNLDLFQDRIAALEGRLDLWGAALWDESRWVEIESTLRQPEPAFWVDSDIKHHWDSSERGFGIVARAEAVEEGFKEEERAREDKECERRVVRVPRDVHPMWQVID
ncbi:hypothetical protein TOPH_05552 [Tolypocladium ophioglossoides CBS 100239]|uniref:Uncharacterized protein n=1 Tax=Tolypocladium ophioglossoides (strain CBS 100239) TaxID=1163406 RepID=A0A0L0N6Y7_TOLOC|nr:hypothetical protein TOPH_05552 [Tolypocladium ophioglossoides CBS 100239]